MDSASLAIVPSRGGHIAEALSNALGRGERNDGEGAAALATPALTLLQSESCHPEPERRRQASGARGRRKLWQLPSVYHCSLLGVCLGLDEMRRMASRLGLCTSARASDYEIHHQLVHHAGIAGRESRRLDRYLEEKFARTLRSFREHRDEVALRKGWNSALEADEDPGGATSPFSPIPRSTRPSRRRRWGMCTCSPMSPLPRFAGLGASSNAPVHTSPSTGLRSSASAVRGCDRRAGSSVTDGAWWIRSARRSPRTPKHRGPSCPHLLPVRRKEPHRRTRPPRSARFGVAWKSRNTKAAPGAACIVVPGDRSRRSSLKFPVRHPSPISMNRSCRWQKIGARDRKANRLVRAAISRDEWSPTWVAGAGWCRDSGH